MMQSVRKWHRWLGVVVVIQIFIWTTSGAIISLLNANTVSGQDSRAGPAARSGLAAFSGFIPISELPIALDNVRSLTLETLFSQPVYRVHTRGERLLFNALSGQRIEVNEPLARKIASANFAGIQSIRAIRKLAADSGEVQGAGEFWRVDFDDELATRFYISTQDGRLVAQGNSRRDLVDFLLMLHFMDYTQSGSFNNVQVIALAFLALWLAVSGLLLLATALSRTDLDWFKRLGKDSSAVMVTVGSASGDPKLSLALESSQTLFDSLYQKNVRLPSICHGVGDCGRCRLRYISAAPPITPAEEKFLKPGSMAKGQRLACQHRARAGDNLLVPHSALAEGSAAP